MVVDGVFSVAALMGAIPVVVIFFFIQKQIISGLSRGGVKG